MLTEKSGFSFIAYGTATVRFIGAATGKLCKNVIPPSTKTMCKE